MRLSPLWTRSRRRSSACQQHGLPHGSPFTVRAEGGKQPASLNLTSALYHVSGASAFTFECPHGLVGDRMCKVGLEEILDIQLTLYEAMLRQGVIVRSMKAYKSLAIQGPLEHKG